jgi:uncharacterized protein (DUF302 family)
MSGTDTELLSFETRLKLNYNEALEKVISSLKSEGFGIITSIDVKDTIKQKLGKEFRDYTILGACNPPLAHRALLADPEVGIMLPCNVTVEDDLIGGTLVRVVNPESMMTIGAFGKNEELKAVAMEAKKRLERVLLSLENM